MKLHLTPQTARDGYDPATGRLYQRPLRFTIDGWPLMATSLDDAKREAERMGEAVTSVEIEH